ncbi:MAG: hypothetical protein SFU56_10785, partial [Capsulimonadales bacterium]|nr:hypothetical protein [Capsulimonadales bacterium]
MEEPRFSLLLKGGQVIDPANGRYGIADVGIANGRIAQVAEDIPASSAETVVDVSGRLVTPGLLDMHMHAYHTRAPEGAPEGLSVVADHHTLRSGVTTAVDTGTAGARHFPHFKRTVIDVATTRILAFVNIVDSGMLGPWEHDVDEMDPERAAATALENPDVCIGIKTAHYRPTQPLDDRNTAWAAVDRSIRAAELCRKPVMFDFFPRVERPYEELLLRRMRPGDIHTHVYARHFPILDEHRQPQRFMFEARERGMFFDLGHGAGSFWFRQAAPMLAHGFPPDTISTDLHILNVNGPVIDMVTTMSKMLNLGMPLPEV